MSRKANQNNNQKKAQKMGPKEHGEKSEDEAASDKGHDSVGKKSVDALIDEVVPPPPPEPSPTSVATTSRSAATSADGVPHTATLALYGAGRELARLAQAAMEKGQKIDATKANQVITKITKLISDV